MISIVDRKQTANGTLKNNKELQGEQIWVSCLERMESEEKRIES